jgi:hypothetical protein
VARPLGSVAGGIQSLVVLIEAYPTAIESDLIDRGQRLRYLGTDRLSWGDLRSILAWLKPDAALSRALRGDDWPWGLQEMLLASAVDYLALLFWTKTKAAQHNRGQPKPIQRPGVASPERIGAEPVSIDDMNDFLGWEVPA